MYIKARYLLNIWMNDAKKYITFRFEVLYFCRRDIKFSWTLSIFHLMKFFRDNCWMLTPALKLLLRGSTHIARFINDQLYRRTRGKEFFALLDTAFYLKNWYLRESNTIICLRCSIAWLLNSSNEVMDYSTDNLITIPSIPKQMWSDFK